MIRKPPLGATIAAAIAIAILCGLGTWQVQRLHWKTALLTQLAQAYADPNPPLLDAGVLQQLPIDPNHFAAARLRGHFISGQELQIGIRTWQEEAGYHAIAAFALDGGGSVLVDRGWVPATQKDPKTRPASLPAAGNLTITGLLHAPGRDNPFVPANQPAQDLWFRWDIAGMAKVLQAPAPVAPFILYEESEPQGTAQPVRAALQLTLPNDHFSYACFWFGLAGILAGMFYARFMRKG